MPEHEKYDQRVSQWMLSGKRDRRGSWMAAVAVCLVVVSGESARAGDPAPAGQSLGGAPLQRGIAPSAGALMAQQKAAEAMPQNEIELVLIGTILQSAAMQAAILENRTTKEQHIYKLGAAVGTGRLTKILGDRVILTFPEGEVELRLRTMASREPTRQESRGQVPPALAVSSAPPAPRSEGPDGLPGLDRDTLVSLSQAPELLTQVQSLGNFGVRVGEVRSGDLLDALGLQKGDIIHTVNALTPGAGLPLAEAIHQALQQAPMLRLEIERDGRHDVVSIGPNPTFVSPGAIRNQGR
jgi:type II secretory pathway component PulC